MQAYPWLCLPSEADDSVCVLLRADSHRLLHSLGVAWSLNMRAYLTLERVALLVPAQGAP